MVAQALQLLATPAPPQSHDQLLAMHEELSREPDSRQAVLPLDPPKSS